MNRSGADDLLLGEWVCLGILYRAPSHGFAVAARLKPDADIGRIWSLSRALTYRSLDQLVARGLVRPVGQEPGIAGGNRTILTATRAGRAAFRRWLHTPVEHMRDLRSELLVKIVLAADVGIDITDMLTAQRARVAEFVDALDAGPAASRPEPHEPSLAAEVVRQWRQESASAALRFLDRLGTRTESGDGPT